MFTRRRRGNPSRSILAGRPTRYPRVEKIAQFAGGSDASIPHERVSGAHHPRTGREESQRNGQLRLAQSGRRPFTKLLQPWRMLRPIGNSFLLLPAVSMPEVQKRDDVEN